MSVIKKRETNMDKKTLDKLADTVEGVPVYAIFPNFPAHQAGIRQGDILLKCNGIRIKDTGEYMQAIKQDVDNVRTFVVWRSGQELDFSVILNKRVPDDSLADQFKDGSVSNYLVPKEDDEPPVLN